MRGDVSISGWSVLPDASCSDHRLIVYKLILILIVAQFPQRTPHNFRYKTKEENWALLCLLFSVHAKDFGRSDL